MSRTTREAFHAAAKEALGLRKQVEALSGRVAELVAAIKRDATDAAVKAGFGASEWEAFVGKHSWDVLVSVPQARPEQEVGGDR